MITQLLRTLWTPSARGTRQLRVYLCSFP